MATNASDWVAEWNAAKAATPAAPASDWVNEWKAAQAAPPVKSAPPESALKDWGAALASAVVRPVAQGVAALPLMAMNAGVASRNLIGDATNKALGRPATPDYELPGAMFDRALDTYTRKPEGLIGNGSEFISTLLAGGKIAPEGLPTAATQAVRSALTEAQQAALKGGESIGMRATPGYATGSKPLQQAEAWASSHPWTSNPFFKVAAGNKSALGRAAASAIGETGNTVDASVLGRANERLGDVFEGVRNPNHTIMFDPAGTGSALDAIDQEFSGLLPKGMSGIRDNTLAGQLSTLASSGHATAEQLGQLSSKLGKAAFKEMTSPNGDRDLGQALYRVKDHADDMLESSLTGDERAAYQQARAQYRNLMHLTSRTNIVNPSSGEVNGVALANRLQQADKPGFLYGKNQSDLYKAARFAQAFKPIVGDSGTATRLGAHGALSSVLTAIGGHMAGLPLEHDMALAAIPLALGGGSNLAARAYLSPVGQMLMEKTPQAAQGMVRLLKGLPRNPALLERLEMRGQQ